MAKSGKGQGRILYQTHAEQIFFVRGLELMVICSKSMAITILPSMHFLVVLLINLIVMLRAKNEVFACFDLSFFLKS